MNNFALTPLNDLHRISISIQRGSEAWRLSILAGKALWGGTQEMIVRQEVPKAASEYTHQGERSAKRRRSVEVYHNKPGRGFHLLGQVPLHHGRLDAPSRTLLLSIKYR